MKNGSEKKKKSPKDKHTTDIKKIQEHSQDNSAQRASVGEAGYRKSGVGI